MTTCPSCHRHEGKHWITCAANRCARCQRAPATIGPWCGPCWKRVQRQRREAVDAALERLGEWEDEP